jgi:hypothetical protein
MLVKTKQPAAMVAERGSEKQYNDGTLNPLGQGVAGSVHLILERQMLKFVPRREAVQVLKIKLLCTIRYNN